MKYKMSEFINEQDPAMNVIIAREQDNDDKEVSFKITIASHKDEEIVETGTVKQDPESVLIAVYEVMEKYNISEAKYTDILLS
jgi:hypothetical protein